MTARRLYPAPPGRLSFADRGQVLLGRVRFRVRLSVGGTSLSSCVAFRPAGRNAKPCDKKDAAALATGSWAWIARSHGAIFSTAPPSRSAPRSPAPSAARDGANERYDLVIVGGGISGLAAAVFYRAEKPQGRVLVLDNHDDFGGTPSATNFC